MTILETARRKLGTGKTLRSLALAAVAATALSGLISPPAHAQERWRWGGDIHRFHEADWDHWRGGHWFHGPHGGRPGWWWVVGGLWYFYPAPIYPYPDPYVPPQLVGGAPPAVVAVAPPPAAPGAPPAAAAPPAPSLYYYCDNPPGYYPYVTQCPTPWRTVPAH